MSGEAAVRYIYQAQVEAVHDGDTVTLTVDQGFGNFRRDRFRLHGPDPDSDMGLNAPEMGTEEGRQAREFLRELVHAFTNGGQHPVVVRTVKDRREKYGRYLAVLYGVRADGSLMNLNQAMVESGQAFLKRY